jgi:MFS superfamily sulfate permease-like transporter
LHIKDESDGVNKIKMQLAEEVTFFNKGAILKELDSLPENSFLELDVTKTKYLDYDILEILEDFASKAKNKNIDIKLISEQGEALNLTNYVDFFKNNPEKGIKKMI